MSSLLDGARAGTGTGAGSAAVGRLVGLQRLAGNGAVSRLLALQRQGPTAGPGPGPGQGRGPDHRGEDAGGEARELRVPGAEGQQAPAGSARQAVAAAAGGGATAEDGAAGEAAGGRREPGGPGGRARETDERRAGERQGDERQGDERRGDERQSDERRQDGGRRTADAAEEASGADAGAEAGPDVTGAGVTGPDDADLISTELAEHERWAGSFGSLGTAGSDDRARFLLDVAGQGAASGAVGGAVMGFAMSAVGAAVGQVAGRRLATLAVSRGLSATPVPGLGPAIGGVMALAGLAMRDWSATGETIGRIGTGTGYERLANDLEGLAEVLDVTMSLMDVVAGVLGGIAVGMWVGAVLSGGTLAPLALTLSAVATGMGIATTAVGMVINVVVRPVVTALRALHAFDSQGDPAQVERQGEQLSAAAGQIGGAVAGALAAKVGARVGTAGGNRIDQGITRLQERGTGGSPSASATSSGGPRLHVEMPEAPAPAAVHTDTDPGTTPHVDADTSTTPHTDTDPGPAPHTDTDPGPAPHADADAGTAPHADTDPGTTPRPDADPGTTPHPDVDADTSGTPRPDATADTGTTPHPDTDPGPAPHADTDPGTTPHPDATADAGTAPHVDVGAGTTPHADGESGTVPRVDPDADAGTAPRSDADTGSTPHPDATPDAGPAPDTETGPPHETGQGTPPHAGGDADIRSAGPGDSGAAPRGDAASGRPVPSAPSAPDPADFSELDPLVHGLGEDPAVQARLTDERPPLARRVTPWGPGEARAYANEQAADHREAAGMSGDTVQAGHTAAARHATESGIREADWDTQTMQPLHSRRDPALAVTVTHQDGSESTNTRHRAQERLIDAAVDRSRTGSADGTLTPRGQLDAADHVAWQTENTPLAQDNVDLLRGSGAAAAEPGARVDPATGRAVPGTGPTPGTTPTPTPTPTPAPASPGGGTHTAPPSAAAAAPTYPDHTRTLAPTSDRAAAMAQYQAQVRADPARESGVWRDSSGNYHVMQGGPGSVAPPSASGPLELIYHSHPTTADPAMRTLNTQPSQAGGDFGVLQYQHGEGPAGRRQTSELHFPVYDGDGNHTGYGATRFAYDPTHPLPLQVHTSTPDGGSTTQRYRDFADFQRRARVGASGDTAAARSAALTGAEARLRADRAEAGVRVDATTRALGPGPGMVGVREGRELGRQWGQGQGPGQGHGQGTTPAASRRGPAYTARVAGPRPGESVEIPVNPAYPAPPGTPAELAALRERIALTRRAQSDLARTEGAMARQAAGQRGQDAQLERAGGVSQQLIEGGRAQSAATGETRSANREQQSAAGGAIENLGRGAQQAGAVATLVGSLRAFQGLAHLFGLLPGSLGASARGASADSARLIAALGRVTETDAARGRMEGQRAGLQANESRIGRVEQRDQRTAGELDQGRRQVEELRVRHQERLGESEATRDQARRERQAAAGDEERTQDTHDELLTRMRAWAGEHRAARESAVAAARARLTAQGYAVRESR
ncbi:hypothetical protein [Streptomyces sp. NPDC090022]|uniref:hypothetical protein n=1 Tax=Streptomyces sp. NPDC090022 TaxID=3365920 RepID=UPI003821A5D7